VTAGTPGPAPARRRRRGRSAVLATVVVSAAAGAGGWWLVADAGAGATPVAAASPGPPATAAVTRQNLVETELVDGTLGYGDQHDVLSGQSGVITWLPAEGAAVNRGQALYRVDNLPVPLIYGSLPLYRPLRTGDEGADVTELEQNLAALGYAGFTADDSYTDETADAVRAWQADLGLAETGTVQPGQLVVGPGPARVAALKTAAGAPIGPGRSVLAYTGTARQVTVQLDVTDQRLARPGGKVTVVLPDGPRLAGSVSSVGTVAHAVPTSQGGGTTGSSGSTSNDATIEVTVTLADPKRAGSFDQAPVQVEFVSAQRTGVLTVPVAALLALREGGYGVQLVAGDGGRIVAVKVGMFASGRVEVTAAGLAAGQLVGVPPA